MESHMPEVWRLPRGAMRLADELPDWPYTETSVEPPLRGEIVTEELAWRKVPEEICDLFDDADVSEQCRDVCVQSWFRAKRAIYYGRCAVKARRKAWELIYELYPDMKGHSIQFRGDKRGVRFMDDKPSAAQESP